MNAAQVMLYKRLKPVQDKEERRRSFSQVDSWRLEVLGKQELVKGQKQAKSEVWGFSRLDPRWESVEGRLEREKRGHHNTKFVLGEAEKRWSEAEGKRIALETDR